MLEFIVLGYIPGTSYQITFPLIATAATLFFGGVCLIIASHHTKKNIAQSQAPSMNVG